MMGNDLNNIKPSKLGTINAIIYSTIAGYALCVSLVLIGHRTPIVVGLTAGFVIIMVVKFIDASRWEVLKEAQK